MSRFPLSLLTISLLFTVLPLVRAQDAAAPFGRFSPAPSPSPTPTPRPKPTPTPPPPPSPTPAATAAPTATPVETRSRPEPTATPRIRTEKPVRPLEQEEPLIRRAPAPRRKGPRASEPTFNLSESSWTVAATIRSLENDWSEAVRTKNPEALAKLLAPDFEGISEDGKTASKSRMLALLRRDKNSYDSVRAHRMTVRSEGPRTAIVTGLSTEKGQTAKGERFKVTRRFVDTWKFRGGRWRCVASKVTEVR